MEFKSFIRLVFIVLQLNWKIRASSRAGDRSLCSTADASYMKIFRISENSAHGTVIGSLGINGTAAGPTQNIDLTLKDYEVSSESNCGQNHKTCSSWLELDPIMQELKLNLLPDEILDRDGTYGVQTINVKLICSVTSGEDTGQQVEMAINVIVDDVNDNPPQFSSQIFRTSINEILPVNSTILKIVATDEDKISEIYYSILESPLSHFFQILIPQIGDISLKKKINYESLAPSETTLNITIAAEDVGIGGMTMNASAVVMVEVLDGDDQAPVFQPCIIRGSSCISQGYVARVSRSAKAGDIITSIEPGPIIAIDPDVNLVVPNTIKYSLFPSPDDTTMPHQYFTINEDTGELSAIRTLPPKENTAEYGLFVMATQNNDDEIYEVTKIVIRIVDTVMDAFAPEFTHGNLNGFVDGESSSEVTFVRNQDGSLLRLVATDRDYVGSTYLPDLKFESVNLDSLFDVTDDGYMIFKVGNRDIGEGFPYSPRVRVVNPEAASEQTKSSSVISVNVVSNAMYEECKILQCNMTDTSSGGDLMNAAGVAVTGSLLFISILALIILLFLVRKYRRERRLFGNMTSTEKTYKGLDFHNAYEGVSSQSSSPSSGMDKIHQKHSKASSTHDTASNHGTVTSVVPRLKIGRNSKKAVITNNNNYIDSNQKQETSYSIKDDSPSIAPYESFSLHNGDVHETSMSSRKPTQWSHFNIEGSLRYDQVTLYEDISHTQQKCGSRGGLSLSDGSKRDCFVKSYTETYQFKATLSNDLIAMEEILNIRSCTQNNFVKLYGCCFHEGSLYVISEFVTSPFDLCSALRNSRMKEHGAVVSSFSGSQLTNFCLAIADAIRYLHGHSIIHGNVSTSEILLTDQLVPKLKECCGRKASRYRKKSLRWAAPEVVAERVYIAASDVWSYAVLMWEILTLGGLPYPNVAEKSVKHHLQSLNTETSPLPVCRNAARRLWMVLESSWNIDPAARPSMTEVYRRMAKIRAASTPITVARHPGYEFSPIVAVTQN